MRAPPETFRDQGCTYYSREDFIASAILGIIITPPDGIAAAHLPPPMYGGIERSVVILAMGTLTPPPPMDLEEFVSAGGKSSFRYLISLNHPEFLRTVIGKRPLGEVEVDQLRFLRVTPRNPDRDVASTSAEEGPPHVRWLGIPQGPKKGDAKQKLVSHTGGLPFPDDWEEVRLCSPPRSDTLLGPEPFSKPSQVRLILSLQTSSCNQYP
nr:hypothetical protein Iba_chr11aCG19050 [Ipomoea batatas]